MILTKEQIAEMREAAKPIMKWLNDNCHPHRKVTIAPSSCTVSELICREVNDEFIKD